MFAYYKNKGLSKRELEVVSLVLHGKTNSEIIAQLNISKGTLKTHLNNLYKKLDSSDASALKTRNLKHFQGRNQRRLFSTADGNSIES